MTLEDCHLKLQKLPEEARPADVAAYQHLGLSLFAKECRAAWVNFAAFFSLEQCSSLTAASYADKLLAEYIKRFEPKETPGGVAGTGAAS